MKFTALEKTLYDAISRVKSATSSSRLVDRMLLLVLEDDLLTIICSAGNIFAQIEVGVKGEENGAVVMPLDSFDVFVYANNMSCEFELDGNNMRIRGDTVRLGNLRIHSTEREHYTVPEFPDTMVPVGEEVFKILYPIDDRNLSLNAVFLRDELFATGNQRAFAGFKNDLPVTKETVAISPVIFSAITRGEFDMGIKNNMVFFKQNGLIVGMPLLAMVNDFVFTYAWFDAEPVAWADASIEAVTKIANITHELSKGKFEDADGRGCLISKIGLLWAVAAGNEIGDGETKPIDAITHENEFIFGFSTKMLKQAVTNVDSDHRIVHITVCPAGEATILVLFGDKTRHFIAEDPQARSYAEKIDSK